MSNSLDPDHTQHTVGPGLGLNCLQRLSADDVTSSKENVNFACWVIFYDFFFLSSADIFQHYFFQNILS